MIGKWECIAILFIAIAVAVCFTSYNLTRTDAQRRVDAYRDCINYARDANEAVCKEVVGVNE